MPWRRLAITLLSGVAMFLAVDLLNAWLAAAGLHALTTRFDDILLGIIAAALAVLLQRQQEMEFRRRRFNAAVIEPLNHHIRNALQIIVTRASLDQKAQPELDQINSAVARIDWALREILPQSVTGEPIPGLEPEKKPRPAATSH